jgi:hypothetical protein
MFKPFSPGGLLVLIPGFGMPHLETKRAILKNNLATLGHLLEIQAFPWIHLTLCIYDTTTPNLLNTIDALIQKSPFVRFPNAHYQIHFNPGIVGHFMLRHAHPATLEALNLSHVFLLLDDVELPATTWTPALWTRFLGDYTHHSLNILSPTMTPDSKILFPFMTSTSEKLLTLVSACEMFCYFMDLASWQRYYEELSPDHPKLWGIDLVLKKHLGFRVGMAHYAQMRHYFQSTPAPDDPSFARMETYLHKFGETQASLAHQPAILAILPSVSLSAPPPH